jgi:glycosyltransferase involved in cell wall biosynthesis
MRILIDYQIFLVQRYGGISHYHSKIHETINRLHTEDQSVILALGSDNQYIPTRLSPLRLLNLKGLNMKGQSVLRQINQKALLLRLPAYDVFHPTYYNPYFLNRHKGVPFVLTVHDVIPERFFSGPRWEEFRQNKGKLLERASRVIAISEATKSAMQEFYKVPEEKISVIPHGRPDHFEKFLETPMERTVHGQPFILFVGLRNAYKNFPSMLQQSAPFLLRHNVRLKVVGPPPTNAELDQVQSLGLGTLVDWEERVPTQKLFQLYREALCFVFPSLEEGFGIPLLEAATAGCPIICTDIPVFHEIARDSANYYDPHFPEALGHELERMLSDTAMRNALIEKGYNNIKRYTWEDATERTLDVYRMSAQDKSLHHY